MHPKSDGKGRKPDPEFFLLACRRNSIKPDEAIFLDDIGVYVI